MLSLDRLGLIEFGSQLAGGGEVDCAALVVYFAGEQAIIDSKRGKKDC